MLGEPEHKFQACDSPELLCVCRAAGRGDPASFPLPHGLCVPAASCAAAGSASRVIRIPCVLREPGWPSPSPAQNGAAGVQFPGPALCVPARRDEGQEGHCPCWEQPGGQSGSFVLETTPWLWPEAACSELAWGELSKSRRDRGRYSAWVPQSWVPPGFGRILLPGISQWGD